MGWPLRKHQTQTQRVCAKQTVRRWTWLTRCSLGSMLLSLFFTSLQWPLWLFFFLSLSLPLKPQGRCTISLLRNVFFNSACRFSSKNNSGVFTDCRFPFFLSVCFLSQSLVFVSLKLKQRVFTAPCPWLTLAAVSPVGPASWLPRGPRRA